MVQASTRPSSSAGASSDISFRTPVWSPGRYVDNNILPLTGRTQSSIKNTEDFIREVMGLCIGEDERLVSFDVESLFTNVPVDESVEVIRNLLRNDNTLEEKTAMDADRIAELLELCLRSTYFCFQDKFYQQKEGATMGSPVSGVVANLYMEHFETLALSSAIRKPRMWKRCVDYTCCVVEKGVENELLDHINKIKPSIKFSMEVEKDGSIPFLECHLKRREDGSLEASVYRKPTHTNRYLQFNSHHPIHVKRGVIKSLFDRASLG